MTTSAIDPNLIPQCSLDELMRNLDTSFDGLVIEQVHAKLAYYGPNKIQETKGKPLLIKFLENFTHLMALMLIVGGIAAFFAQMPQIGWAIWAVVVINGVFSFWQEFRADKASEALKRLLPTYVRVVRNGGEEKILAEELVPGDIMILAEGDKISADGRLIAESELQIDQSTLTGESQPVSKDVVVLSTPGQSLMEMKNIVFAGTAVTAGTGKAVVTFTGMQTQFGKIASLTQSLGDTLSPLQKEIQKITKLVSVIAIGIGIFFFFISYFFVGRSLFECFVFSLGMIVAFTPEGLLPTVTLALAMGVQRMAKRHALIKKLSSVETLGACTVICTDKTGTLTQNEMTVQNILLAGISLQVTGVGYDPIGKIVDSRGVEQRGAKHLQQLLVAATLCNNARLLAPEGKVHAQWSILGDPTEAALLVVAKKIGIDAQEIAQTYTRVRELPFESRRKRMSTLHRFGTSGMAFTKGAPKEMLALCSTKLTEQGVQNLSPEDRDIILKTNDEYARKGLRVLAVAQKEMPDVVSRTAGYSQDYTIDTIETSMTFLGLIAMMDPPRTEVATAVEKCHTAGVRIIMITGDYGLTAESIARRIGIVSGSAQIITGSDLDMMTHEEITVALRSDVIFARVAPEHKLLVVRLLQEMGEIVAVTGDGVNDAPALKKADIGVAMGITGTDVAKEAASMILTDDNFASIVNAIEEGRAVYTNIKRFTTYTFTSNVTEAWPFVFQILFNIPLALTVMQVLAIDIGTDLLPALALGVEAPEPGIMQRPPRKKTDRLVDGPLLVRAFLWLGSLQTVLCFIAFFFLFSSFGYTDFLHLPRVDLLPYTERLRSRDGLVYVLATTIFHVSVITTQIGNAYCCRTEKVSLFTVGIFSNKFLLVGVVIELLTMVIMVYVQPLQAMFEHASLPFWPFWPFIILFAPIMVLCDELKKAHLRSREQKNIVQGKIVQVAH